MIAGQKFAEVTANESLREGRRVRQGGSAAIVAGAVTFGGGPSARENRADGARRRRRAPSARFAVPAAWRGAFRAALAVQLSPDCISERAAVAAFRTVASRSPREASASGWTAL